MATIGLAVTLMDIARRMGPDNKISALIELMTKQNEILQDARFMEGNLPIGNKTTVRTGLPSVTWRKLNYGVQPSKSTSKQVTDSCGMLEAYAEVDKALADLNGNAPAWRLSEDAAFLEAMNQAMATALFYGDTATDPEKFVGLAPRYDSISTDDTLSGFNVVSGLGSGSDNTSIWLLTWGDQATHCIYPKGGKAGFTQEDLGQVTLTDAASGRYEGYRTHYRWDIGLTVRDWRHNVRIANIDYSNLVGESSAADLIKLMTKAVHKLPSNTVGQQVFYCNRDVLTMLDIQTQAKSNLHLSYQDVMGQKVLSFRGIPIRRCDAILNTEATVS